MPRRAKQPEPTFSFIDFAGQSADLAGRKIAENPTFVGASVAFAVVMFFVSSNALFYQPFPHKDALFETRSMQNYKQPDLPKPVALKSGRIKSQVANSKNDGSNQKIAVPAKDLQLIDIQSALARLKFYDGSIDGVAGPKTRAAIEQFQQQAGLEPTGKIDPLLIDAIRTASIPVNQVPRPTVRADETDQTTDLAEDAVEEITAEAVPVESDGGISEDEIRKIQAGLKAFGNDAIEIDGKLGAKTKDAIVEFQRLFQIEVSGSANRETLDKLQELGLVSG